MYEELRLLTSIQELILVVHLIVYRMGASKWIDMTDDALIEFMKCGFPRIRYYST